MNPHRSKRLLPILLLVACAWHSVSADELRVTGDRVNLRSRPALAAGEIVGQTGAGQTLERAGDPVEKENFVWVPVHPPEGLRGYVSAAFVSNGVVQAGTLNVRAGPSINFGVIGTYGEGELIHIEQSEGDWLKVPAPDDGIVWIADKFVQPVTPPPPPEKAEKKPEDLPSEGGDLYRESPEAEVTQEPSEKKKPAPETTVGIKEKASPAEMDTTVKGPHAEWLRKAGRGPELPLFFDLDEDAEQGVEAQAVGRLLDTESTILYRLVDDEGELVTLVRGREGQMKKYVYWRMKIEGRRYRAEDVESPIVIPEVIRLLKKPPEHLLTPDEAGGGDADG
ncbi:SH3 domain-containing protein [Kiritimatiella glycovorans]|uniref:SH3b domain-containing protein n=1 Tax=Kiritimatiella glycovorans TaxID=1307763 RepID=A0A0G3EBW3_9BACT|nr:SH3 domain-containing protein [Kiritimatiella glycovorans]AKJ63793.1 hypothetical protein L21SP4_00521 [Kiritimatiella glycovorans]